MLLYLYYLITSEVNSEERFELLKKHDTPNDYTYYETEEKNREKCKKIVETSQYIKNKCKEYNKTVIYH